MRVALGLKGQMRKEVLILNLSKPKRIPINTHSPSPPPPAASRACGSPPAAAAPSPPRADPRGGRPSQTRPSRPARIISRNCPLIGKGPPSRGRSAASA